jgi:hypothetical protein
MQEKEEIPVHPARVGTENIVVARECPEAMVLPGIVDKLFLRVIK